MNTNEFEATLIVRERHDAADGVVTLTLGRPDGGRLPSWSAGAHIDLVLGAGLTRQYSLCGPLSDPATWRIGVLREPESRGGSRYVHDNVRVGDEVHVRGPRNQFPLAPAKSYQFIAGGIGITPFLAMIAEADTAGIPWRLTYGGRTRRSMAFLDELHDVGERVEIVPQDECGLLDLAALLGEAEPDTAVYCCGPGPLLDAVAHHTAGWPQDNVRFERFTADPAALAGSVANAPFDVVCESSGISVTVAAEESIVSALARVGMTVPTSCAEGLCGTCETGVLQGVPDHRDSLLTDEEHAANDTMLLCVSRCAGNRLTLDL